MAEHLARLVSLVPHLEVAVAQANITLQFSSIQALNQEGQVRTTSCQLST